MAQLGAGTPDATKVLYGDGSWKAPPAASATSNVQPRGTGGTTGSLTTRAIGTSTRRDLLPSDPADDYADDRLAWIDADNKAIGPGGTGRATGLGLTGGKDYYVDIPASAGGINLKAIPADTTGWPTAAVSNVGRRYYKVGSVWADGAELYLTRSSMPVVLSTDAAPGGRLDVAALPYNTDLIAGGQIERVLKIAGSTAAVTKVMAEGDSGVPSEIAASPILKDIGGTQKKAAIYQHTNGTHDLLTIPGTPSQPGGEYLWRFGVGSDWANGYPSIFFGFTGGPGVAGAHYAVTVSPTRVGLRYYTTDTANAIAESFLTDVAHNLTRVAGAMYNLRVKVDGAAKTVYARFWKEGDPEPTAWLLNGASAVNLISGRFGWRIKNAPSLTSNFVWMPEGETASYA